MNLLKKNAKVCFADAEKPFEQLREVLCKKLLFRIYNTEAETDAFAQAYAVLFLQRGDGDRSLHPVHYARGKQRQRNRSIITM